MSGVIDAFSMNMFQFSRCVYINATPACKSRILDQRKVPFFKKNKGGKK